MKTQTLKLLFLCIMLIVPFSTLSAQDVAQATDELSTEVEAVNPDDDSLEAELNDDATVNLNDSDDDTDAIDDYEEASADLDTGTGTIDDDSKYLHIDENGNSYFLGDDGSKLTAAQYVSYKNRNKIIDLIVRFLINTIFVFIITRAFYFPKSRRRDFFFTYILVGFAIFMLIHLMSGETMETGIGMGLFAIFCIMRYRTESVPIREMTYLFLVIAMAALNGMAWDISSKKPSYIDRETVAMGELLITNILFVLIVRFAESKMFAKGLSSKYIKYDKIDLIVPEKEAELIADLKTRTGLDITAVNIGSIDFLKDMALIKVFYKDKGIESENINKMPKMFE